MKLYEIAQSLEERKSVGLIYHFTSYKGMMGIINSGFKLINKNGVQTEKGENFISFTRNKQLTNDTVFTEVRISIDGNKLSDRYQIKPYSDKISGYGRFTHDESEERALVKKRDGYIDISRSVVQIDVMNIKTLMDNFEDDEDSFSTLTPPSLSDYNGLLNVLKRQGIPFNIVMKF